MEYLDDEFGGVDLNVPAPKSTGFDATTLPKRVAYSFLKKHHEKYTKYCVVAEKKEVDFSLYEAALIKLMEDKKIMMDGKPNYDIGGMIIANATLSGMSSEISTKITFFDANDVNASNDIRVRLNVPVEEVKTKIIAARRGINYANPPCSGFVEVTTSAGSYIAPVTQGITNTNYVEYDTEVVSDPLGIKKVFAHLVLLTRLDKGRFVPRIDAISVYNEYKGVAVFTANYDKEITVVCDELNRLCADYSLNLDKDSVDAQKYGAILSKMYDKIYSKDGNMKSYSVLLSAYNRIIRSTTPSGAKVLNPDKTVRKAGLIPKVVDVVDADGDPSTSRTVEYVSVKYHSLVSKNKSFDLDNADAAMAFKVLQDSRKWGGLDGHEFNVGQRDYLHGVWIGFNAGDVVRTAANLRVFKENNFIFEGDSKDLTRICRSLAYTQDCLQLADPEYKRETFTIITLAENMKNNSSFIASSEGYVYSKDNKIIINAVSSFAGVTFGTAAKLMWKDPVAGVKNQEVVSSCATVIRDMARSEMPVIRKMKLSTVLLQSMLEYNKGKSNEQKITCFSSTEIHNGVCWFTKGIELREEVLKTRYVIDSPADARQYYRAMILVNQFRMFNTFWNLPFSGEKSVMVKMYGVKIPYVDVTAPISFVTVAALTSADGYDELNIHLNFNKEAVEQAFERKAKAINENNDNSEGEEQQGEPEIQEFADDGDCVQGLKVGKGGDKN